MQTSIKILIIALTLLGLTIGNLALFVGGIKNVERDAAHINSLGVIRGSIQRIAKLELFGVHEPEFIDQTDKRVFGMAGVSRSLKTDWSDLKRAIERLHHEGATPEIQALLLEASERCWASTNNTVFAAQYASEKKMGNFGLFGWAMAINIGLLALVLAGVRSLLKKRVEYRASHDPLTGAANRAELERRLPILVKNEPLVCLMIDIDHFKLVNDTYGHGLGDRVLQKVAETIRAHCRRDDLFVRYGGEEFVLLAPGIKAQRGHDLAERIRAAIERHAFEEVGDITVSIGLAAYRPGETPQTLLERADMLLYQAKTHGRNRVVGDGSAA